jgi:transcriptional regulator with XRE-family HTH domain
MGVHPDLTGIVRSVYNASMPHLSKFMEDRELSDETVSEAIGVSRVTISRIRRGKVRPDWSTIGKLKEFSGGEITADDFVDLPEGVRA